LVIVGPGGAGELDEQENRAVFDKFLKKDVVSTDDRRKAMQRVAAYHIAGGSQ
jgi:hypothetical protein